MGKHRQSTAGQEFVGASCVGIGECLEESVLKASQLPAHPALRAFNWLIRLLLVLLSVCSAAFTRLFDGFEACRYIFFTSSVQTSHRRTPPVQSSDSAAQRYSTASLLSLRICTSRQSSRHKHHIEDHPASGVADTGLHHLCFSTYTFIQGIPQSALSIRIQNSEAYPEKRVDLTSISSLWKIEQIESGNSQSAHHWTLARALNTLPAP